MIYDESFYIPYIEHLKEPIVRLTHDEMFGLYDLIIRNFNPYHDVLDLGCGTCEYERYHRPLHGRYIGIDESEKAAEHEKVIQANYLKDDWQSKLKFRPHSFISIFSTEIALSAEDKYNFYEHLFKTMKFNGAMVAGFYYEDQKDKPEIEEDSSAGKFIICQTIENQCDFINDTFSEMRCYRKVPSKLWGPNVVEVWKFLVRKDNAT